MIYKTFEPHPELCPFVKLFWTLKGPKESVAQKQRIVPDGCMEMIFHLGDLYKQYLEDSSSVVQPRCFVFGQITSTLDIEPTGETDIFAVRFSPEGFIPFAPVSIHEMDNRAVALHELFGEEGAKFEREILLAESTKERIKICESFLISRLVNPEAIDRRVKSCVELILNLNGQLSVNELSNTMKINRRQLERRFSTVIGLSPKQFSKIIRLQAALKMLLNKQFTSLTALAHEGEYYDQAHFSKDFKEFTGMSPKKFYADNLRMSSLFYGTE